MPSTGPNYPSASEYILADESSPATWSNMTNAYASDFAYASCLVDLGQTSVLRLTNFGFSLPADVAIVGITLETSFKSIGTGEDGSSTGQDQVISLVRSDSEVGDNLASVGPGGYTPETPTSVSYGGSTNLWGTTWTKAQIEDSSFGVDLKYADFFSGNLTAGVDYARITVYYSGVQTVEPGGIASAEAFGTATIVVKIAPTGIASTEAFGTAVLTSIATILPSGIAAGGIGNPTITVGGVSVSPSGIDSGEAFGSAVLTNIYTLRPTGITSGEAFGSLVVVSNQFLSPTGIGSGEAFGTAQLNQGLGASGISSGETFGSPTMTLGLAPTGISSGETFGLPVMVFAQTVSPTGITSSEAFGVAQVAFLLSPTGIGSGEAFGSPTLVPGAVSIFPVGWNEGAMPVPRILRTIAPTGIASSEAFGTALVAQPPTYRIPITIRADKVGEDLDEILLPITVSLVEAHYSGATLVFLNAAGEVLADSEVSIDDYGTVRTSVRWDRIEADTDNLFYIHYR